AIETELALGSRRGRFGPAKPRRSKRHEDRRPFDAPCFSNIGFEHFPRLLYAHCGAGVDIEGLRTSLTSSSRAGIVLSMIFKSSHGDFVRTYSMSQSIIWSNVIRFFPETCQSPVRPGRVRNRSRCWGRQQLYSVGRHGRGPTTLISPRSTLMSWGSSS